MTDNPAARLAALAAGGFFLQEAEQPEPATTRSSRRALLAPLAALQQRVYAIRIAVPSDTDALVALEAECWEPHLQASRTEIASRLGDPACTTYVAVLRMAPPLADRIAAVLYTQRIDDAHALLSPSLRQPDVADLRCPGGPIVQLLAVASRPSQQHLRLGQALREHALQLAELGAARQVVAVTRCREFFPAADGHTDAQFDAHVAAGRDAGLRFHLSVGAAAAVESRPWPPPSWRTVAPQGSPPPHPSAACLPAVTRSHPPQRGGGRG